MKQEGQDARTAKVLRIIGAAARGDDRLLEKILPPIARGRDVVTLTEIGESQVPGFVAPALRGLGRPGRGPTSLFLSADKRLTAAALRSLAELKGPRPPRTVALSEERAVRREAKDLEERPDIVVATPARLIDHIRRGHLHLSTVRCAVILESPAAAAAEFRRDVQFIASKLPRRRQTIVAGARLDRQSALGVYPLRRPVFIEAADIEPRPKQAAASQKKTRQEKAGVSSATDIGPNKAPRPLPDEKLMGEALETILKEIRQLEDPEQLNRYRQIVKRHVPIFMRSYVAAYLFKKSLDGFVSRPAETTTLFVSIGKNRRVFPKDLIKLFMDRLEIERSQIGEVKVLESYSFVDIGLDHAQEAISKLSGINFRGRRLTVNLARKKTEAG